MANLREALAGTAYASLEWSPDWERAIDRVAASGRVTRLGLDLWKARYMLEVSSYHAARKALLEKCANKWQRLNYDVTRRIVDQCLMEFIAPFCLTCRGAKEIIIEKRRIVCYDCAGVGVRRFTDSDRASAMNLSFDQTQKLGGKFRWLLDAIMTWDGEVNAILAVELERDPIDNGKSATSIALPSGQPVSPVRTIGSRSQ